MATYKQPCIQCGKFIERDSRFCSNCGSMNPFGYRCPTCLKSIERENILCSGCGRSLSTACPYCKQQTFVGSENCDQCAKSLMIHCESKRCDALQFFENSKCTVCGKPIKKGEKQISEEEN